MIDTIILDVGNVLVDYDWKKYLNTFGYSEEINEKIADAMFLSRAWDEADRSLISDEEILDLFIHNCPELEREIREVFATVGKSIEARSYAVPWVKSFKEAGYKVYILSNYSSRTYEQTKDVFGFLKEVDGAVFSYQVKKVKPEPEIYEELLKQYEIVPEQAVFIDDLEANLAAARKFGIQTIQFRTLDQVQTELENFGVMS